jgi:peptide chain release factor subunit 1
VVARRRIPAATWRALPLKRHFRWVADVLEGLLRSDGYDILIAGGHDYEMPEFLHFLPLDLRDRVAGTFRIDPTTAPLADMRASVAQSCGATSANSSSTWFPGCWNKPRQAGRPRSARKSACGRAAWPRSTRCWCTTT